MANPLHRLIGFILSRQCVYTRLERIAMADPDTSIMSPDGSEVYMYRGWLFNKITDQKRKYPLLPFSIRVHRIMMPDLDRHMHDHPWNARTFIMHGGYDETRLLGQVPIISIGGRSWGPGEMRESFRRRSGDTSTLGFEQYHKITRLHDNVRGALTLFAFGDWNGDWGFMVNGQKVLRRDYEAMMGKDANSAAVDPKG